MQRIHAIDYFRGIMALSVLIYHFFSWSVGVPESDSTLGRLGIYAVSAFYVISGVSLYLVYSNSRWGKHELWSFGLKRFLRLAPVYWLATSLMILFAILGSSSYEPDWFKYFANFTLTFGLYSPREYMPVGGWSIGNEVAFYVFFPFLMICLARAWSFVLALVITLGLYVYFSFFVLTPQKTLPEQWGLYILPFNQAFLFVAGVAVAWVKDKHYSPSNLVSMLIILASVAIFIFYPAEGDKINIVTGWARLLLTATCIGVCFSLLSFPDLQIKWLSRPLGFLGDTSYTIYMLHGASALYANRYVAPMLGISTSMERLLFLLLGVLPFVLMISFFVYRYLELPFIRLGKKQSTTHAEQKAKEGPASAGWF